MADGRGPQQPEASHGENGCGACAMPPQAAEAIPCPNQARATVPTRSLTSSRSERPAQRIAPGDPVSRLLLAVPERHDPPDPAQIQGGLARAGAAADGDARVVVVVQAAVT